MRVDPVGLLLELYRSRVCWWRGAGAKQPLSRPLPGNF